MHKYIFQISMVFLSDDSDDSDDALLRMPMNKGFLELLGCHHSAPKCHHSVENVITRFKKGERVIMRLAHRLKLSEGLSDEIPDSELDPRPDIGEDHHLWVELLAQAYRQDRDLHGILHGFRCAGTMIKKASRGYRLRVPYEKLISEEPGWRSRDEIAGRWLEPYRDQISDLLSSVQGDGI